MRFHAILPLLCTMLLPILARGEDAQADERLFRNWTTHDGLPHNRVKVMTQTRDGFLWLGTDGGLARFDGVRFETYGLENGLAGMEVRALLERRDGSLWGGTVKGGISEIREGRVVRTYGADDGLPSPIRCLAEDSEGRVWVGAGGKVLRFENGRFVEMPKPPSAKPNAAAALICSREGTMWAAFGDRGVFRWTGEHWESPEGEHAPKGAGALAEDAEGRLCVGLGMTFCFPAQWDPKLGIHVT